jgi:hypothetical protein
MDRLEFICHALIDTIDTADEGHSPLTDYMLAVAIRSEIETVRRRPAGKEQAIETYMIQTRAFAV